MSALAITLLSCSGGGGVHAKRVFFRMGTVTEITVSVPKSYHIKPLWNAVDSLLSQSENRFSVTGDSSEVMALNGRGGARALPVSPALGGMLRTGLAYGDTLGGSFDVTVLPLKELWGLCEQCAGDEPLPDSLRVAAAVRRVDYRKVRVSAAADSVFFDSPDTRIDVGGLAKGHVLRLLEALLKDRGVDNFLIAAGGDVIASGRKGDGAPWRVGVQHPRNREELITTVALRRGALVTSGDYERARVAGKNRYHHIFDPATGYPCGRNQSLTIWAPDPVRADILSTGLFCDPAEQIIEFVRARDSLECFIVDSDGKTRVSAGWPEMY
jgi:thiamine biosynthesis lipoprotein